MVTENEDRGVKIEINRDPDEKREQEGKEVQKHAPSQPAPVEDETGGPETEPEQGDPMEALKAFLSHSRDVLEGADELLALVDEAADHQGPAMELASALAGRYRTAMELAAQNRDRWMRAAADLENYKKRMTNERSRLVKYQNEELLRDLLPILDNMERALGHAEEDGNTEPLVDGIKMIVDMFKDVLARHGVEAIETVGQPFDPNVHEAICQVPDSGMEPNRVVQEVEKGYTYKDRLLRAAKVTVSVKGD